MKIDPKKINIKHNYTTESKKKESLIIEDSIDIAKFVKSFRKKNNISQDELAKYSNVSRLAINEFENGKSDIKFSTLLKVLKANSLLLEIRER